MNLPAYFLIFSLIFQLGVDSARMPLFTNTDEKGALSIAKREADPRKRYYSRGRPRYSSGRSNTADLGNLIATKAVVGAAAVGGGLLALGLANGGLNGISIPAINLGK